MRFRALRLERGLKQETVADRAGVTMASLRRFERTGEVSLKHLARLLLVVGRLEELTKMLAPAEAGSIAQLESRLARATRKRGTR